MPVWRCPHCGTPQAETSRCWVCRRSTTSCATCRHFRRGIAGGLGLCGLDPRHVALRGTEMRACWVAPEAGDSPVAATRPHAPATPAPPAGRAATAVPARTFVPVDEVDPGRGRGRTRVAATARSQPAGEPGGWPLWGDAEG